MCGPTAFGVKLTEQLAEPPLPESVQLAALKVPPLLVQLTVPVGVVAEPGVASVTVAVQLVALPTGTEAGEQFTVVVVSCLVAVTTKKPLDPLWLVSPP